MHGWTHFAELSPTIFFSFFRFFLLSFFYEPELGQKHNIVVPPSLAHQPSLFSFSLHFKTAKNCQAAKTSLET